MSKTRKKEPVAEVMEVETSQANPDETNIETTDVVDELKPKTPWWKNWKVLAAVGAGAAAIVAGGVALCSRGSDHEDYRQELEDYCEDDDSQDDSEEEETDESDE